jgi:1-acyl-sn-glycerol-3-phosphate acyltransferase
MNKTTGRESTENESVGKDAAASHAAPIVPTWNEVDPPVLPPVGSLRTAVAAVKVGIAAIVTLVLFTIYVGTKPLYRLFGHRMVLHRLAQRFWGRILLRLLAIKLVTVGKPMKTGGAIVANHVSWLDILALTGAARVNFVAKSEVKTWPVMGIIARATDTVFVVRRRSEAKRQQADLLEQIERGELLALFPEGTSSDGMRVLPFKSTLMAVMFTEGVRDSAYVQPVTLSYRPDTSKGAPANLYGWWGDMEFGRNIWDVLLHSRRGVVEVKFHEPTPVCEFANRKTLTRYAENTVREGLNIVETIQSDV